MGCVLVLGGVGLDVLLLLIQVGLLKGKVLEVRSYTTSRGTFPLIIFTRMTTIISYRLLFRHYLPIVLLLTGRLTQRLPPRGAHYVTVVNGGHLQFPREFGVQLGFEEFQDLVQTLLQELHTLTQLVSRFVILADEDLFDEPVDLLSSDFQLPCPVSLALRVQTLQDLVKFQSHELL